MTVEKLTRQEIYNYMLVKTATFAGIIIYHVLINNILIYFCTIILCIIIISCDVSFFVNSVLTYYF